MPAASTKSTSSCSSCLVECIVRKQHCRSIELEINPSPQVCFRMNRIRITHFANTMERKCCFVQLPSDILSHLVTFWLKWKDVAQCDVAICNKAGRHEWLDLLKNECVFSSILIGYERTPNNVAWLASRYIRVRELDIGCYNIRGKVTAMEKWLQEAGAFVQVVKIARYADFVLQCIDRFCHNLAVFVVHTCRGEDTCWNVIRNNPNLVELRMHGDLDQSVENTLPTHLSLPFLQKLDIDCDSFTNKNVVALLKRLPELRCLQLFHCRFSQQISLYECLPESCPQLVHLDLRCTLGWETEKDRLTKLLMGLKRGLHTLLLPDAFIMMKREKQTIIHYHAHSLSCLSITAYKENGDDGCNLAELLNSLPMLHTLQLSYMCLVPLIRGPIVNTNIVHLFVDLLCKHDDLQALLLCGHFPRLTTLSLCGLEGSADAKNLVELLNQRERIRTVCVDSKRLIVQLREKVPPIEVSTFVPLDVFSFAL